MENVHNAIAWYQKKIGSYDKQLWEQSVEKKLQKQPPFVLHNAPSKKVRLKTEYIDVDLIRGSTFAKAKPQVPWVYITRKAIARVLFFPFYYNWWVHQTSKQLYAVLLVLYVLQVLTIFVYLRNFDHSIMEDELSFTEVILPTILMFLLCLIHSQTVLAHISHKPPKRSKSISGVTKRARPKKVQRKGRTSGNNSTCMEDGCNTDTTKPPSVNASASESKQQIPDKNSIGQDAQPATLDMEKILMSRSVSDYDLKPMTTKGQNDPSHKSHPLSLKGSSTKDVRPKTPKCQAECNHEGSRPQVLPSRQPSQTTVEKSQTHHPSSCNTWGPNVSEGSQPSGFSYNLLNNLPNLLTVEKVSQELAALSDNDDTEDGDNDVGIKMRKQENFKCVQLKGAAACHCDSVNHTEMNSKDWDTLYLVDGASNDFVDNSSKNYSAFKMAMKASKTNCHCEEKSLESSVAPNKCLVHASCTCRLLNGRKTKLQLHPENRVSSKCSFISDKDIPELGAGANVSQMPDPLFCSCKLDHDKETVTSNCSVVNKQLSTSTSGVADVFDISLSKPDLKAMKSSLCEHCTNVKYSLKPNLAYSKDCPSCPFHKHADRSVKNHHVTFSNNHPHQRPVGSHSWPDVLVQRHVNDIQNSDKDCICQLQSKNSMLGSESQLQNFSEAFVQELLSDETFREMSCNSLLVHSDLENSSSSFSHLSNSSSSISSLSSSYRVSNLDHIPTSLPSSLTVSTTALCSEIPEDPSQPTIPLETYGDKEVISNINILKNDTLDESMEQINLSDGERPSDVSNYNPSDSDGESDVPENEELLNKFEEKWKKLRFQEQDIGKDGIEDKLSQTASSLPSSTGINNPNKSSVLGKQNDPRSVVGILTRKPSPLKDLALGRTANCNVTANSSGSDIDMAETRSQLRRRRRASGTAESGEGIRNRNVPSTLGLRPHESSGKHLSSSENETGGHTPEGSNKATMSSEEWEDHMQSDETTSSNYSSSCGNSDDSGEDGEEKTEYTTSTLHVINLLQPGLQPGCLPHLIQTSNGLLTPGISTNQSFMFRKPQQGGSPTSSGTITQSDKVACVIWEGNECKKLDLTALDIGWAIIDKVDSLPESSDYFLIGLLFSVLMGLVPIVFRVYVNKEMTRWEDFISWSGILAQLSEVPSLIFNTYSWRQYLLMINGILQRFFLSLIFFFLLSVADRTFKQRLLYAKHFSYLTSSRRARKFAMPHFRLNKVRNIKIWLSLRSYLKRRGPQRSVDVIVSASFMCAICTVCLISLQMLKDTESFLDYLCNWELMVWCIGLGVFLMRFMTVGLKINKKYRNLSVLITEQINLYLQMEQKPHKKEELILANNVLRLAEDLLKELESPFKISGFSANPLIYNIMRVVVLSAFSAVLTEVLGFKLKLHKIKLKG
uniref:PHTF1/2 N-terminal domain-containing protein n=1 Tax=Biomphalaria glabrata TaxID=6526 RepID=A0A2C9JQE2_BIOGL